MKKVIVLLSLFAVSQAHAASGIFGAYLSFDVDSVISTYGENQPGPNTTTGYNGSDLGTVNTGESVTLSFAEVLTFKNGGSDVTGASINFRVYETGSPSGVFTETGINFGSNAPFTDIAGNNFTNAGDQSWNNITTSTDVANGLSAGNYTVEVFWKATSTDGDHFVNNGGSNYTATFEVVPEPSTYAALFGLAVLGLAAWRRRRS
ncbi:PEP-CTERM sorting domain-containing protein [Rubellicoccus peritrichatus]|uniref:PEP-CTERM sorting domain-containing protein n=1 Tax=Rubellicoccus peritrichatus TaxID=3080537 RepID=A0AAQ3L809_9BACT|nr:PEP-CTERM sorting domain-containing protein [Puniceicoccus sp. CR14]WOO41354.1 PEP-CTERM sorting domain-containing protein [Puniceicoccus sp. CR14]